MNKIIQKLSISGLLAALLSIFISSAAFAHVVVKPAEVVTAGFQSFTMGVPNEKEIPTTSIKLVMPDGLKFVSPSQKTGWQIDVEKEGTGEDAKVKSITWSGSAVNAGFRDDFTFSAQVPEKATELQWKAYQTYSNGEVVAWDQAPKAGHDDEGTKPFSVTKVSAETEADASIRKADQAAADARDKANIASYIAVAGVLIGLAAVYFATKNK